MDNLAHDIRYALRGMSRKPAFALTAILTMALGIGGNIAMFSFVDTFLLQPLPYRQANRLAVIEETNMEQEIGGSNVSFPNLNDWKMQNRTLEDIAGFAPATLNLSDTAEPERLNGGMVWSEPDRPTCLRRGRRRTAGDGARCDTSAGA